LYAEFHEERGLLAALQSQLEQLVRPYGHRLCFVEPVRSSLLQEMCAVDEAVTLSICEVSRCMPYFVVLIGLTFGWRPLMGDSAFTAIPWLRHLLGKSLLEILIECAARHSKWRPDRCHAFVRTPARPESVSVSELCEANELRRRLSALHVEPTEYSSPAALGVQLLSVLRAALAADFGLDRRPVPPTIVELDNESQHARAQQLQREAVLDRKRAAESLIAAAATHQMVLLHGAPGSGKSVVLQAFVTRAMQLPEKVRRPVFCVHCDAAEYCSPAWVMLRIVRFIKEQMHATLALPASSKDVDALDIDFRTWLAVASARGGLVVVVDAVEAVGRFDTECAVGAAAPVVPAALQWIPATLPSGVAFVLATHDEACVCHAERRRWVCLAVTPLAPLERRKLAAAYIASASVMPSEALLERDAVSTRSMRY
jgi:hypothetical protein